MAHDSRATTPCDGSLTGNVYHFTGGRAQTIGQALQPAAPPSAARRPGPSPLISAQIPDSSSTLGNPR
ncbi:hypothetical protein [Haliangium sp. UPWRP_2]|uniref:hypothetical protein n=1 Tax=Haliangium sp. UPWRP_2 TaxID=1931276 RepID=UPI001304E31A|nr:hypothetical protein [Haliangium sp. UPWRP_2]